LAKNLKLTIKNAQLAEALKKFKKPAEETPKKKAESVKKEVKESPLPIQEASEPIAPAPVPVIQEPEIALASPEPKVEPRLELPPEVKKEARLPPKPQPKIGHIRPPIERRLFNPKEPAPKTPYVKPPMPAGFTPRSEAGAASPGRYPSTFRSPGAQSYRPGISPGGRPPFNNRPYSGAPRPSDLSRSGGRSSPRSIPIPQKDAARTEAPKKSKDEKGFKDFSEYKPAKKTTEGERSFDSRDRQGLRADEDQIWRKRKRSSPKFRSAEEEIIRPKSLKVRIPITIKDLAAEMKLKASQLVSNLFMKGVVLTLNDLLDDETTIQLLGHDFECEITIDTSEEERLQITGSTIKQEIQETAVEQLTLRNPVVTFMGHVDHGKTSLIDAIRKTNVAGGEAGAITQHIGAFRCHTAVGNITILDTPGHEAFSAMRTRGADVTDLVVLVIAGDEGIRTQTIEALKQAEEAKVPIMVAINKCDKPGFNADTIYRQLSEHNLLPEVWGGQTITVNCSALTGTGIKELLEMLALQAEVLELKANPQMRARGTVIESQMHKGFGAVTTVLVQNGTLHLGDALVFDHEWGRVKTMHDEFGSSLEHAEPSTPVKITGLSGLPEAGSEFIVVKNEKEARQLSEGRLHNRKNVALQAKKAGVEGLLQHQAQKQEKKVLHLILRADVQGSLEALKQSIEKIQSEKINVLVVSSEVGAISESDIQLAGASKATIIGFHTQVETRADSLIKELKVKVRLHDIIYHAIDDIKEIMVSLLDKVAQENDIGEAVVKAIFKSSQLGSIAGCQVSDGIIRRNSHVRLVRDKEVLWKGPLASLKRVKEDVKEVSKGMECGILLQGFAPVKEGDIIQAFDLTYLTQEL
jgi:translation initiation factor IF-2